ncbi:hypothetical protein Tco_0430185, partial [Tanacetum coccineum]
KSADDIMTFRKELDALALKHLGPEQTIVATSTTEAEYVAAAHCCGQVLCSYHILKE